MNLEEFVKAFAELCEDTDPAEITSTTEYHDLDEWSSLIGLSLIVMVKTNMGKTVTGNEIKSCNTIEELYNLISAK